MSRYDVGVGNRLIKLFAENRAVNAYIVVGERTHIPTLLQQCAAISLCESHTDDNCNSCKKVWENTHQDVICLPQDKTKNKITVDDINYLVDESVKRPVDKGDTRVFTLDATLSCVGAGCSVWQNKLLKTLEEPLDGIYIFIGVTDSESLLPTVISRCQILLESKISVAEVKTQLMSMGFSLQSAEIAAAMSQGNTENAQKLLADTAVFEAYQRAEEMLVGMTSTKNTLQYVAAAQAIKDKITDFLTFATVLLRESIVVRTGMSNLCLLPSKAECVAQIGTNYSIEAAQACIELINKAKKRLDDGGNLAVVLDNLTIGMMEVKYRCRI